MMAQPNRLPPPHGLLIDRTSPVSFSFEGRRYDGYEGDCIASALAANGRWVLSRSFKYHRPRGVLTMAGQDGNSLVQLPGEPNVLADRMEIAPDMAVTAQNVFGSLQRDRAAVLGRLARFMPVGFYYRAFYKPGNAFKFWERIIRAVAGLGRIDPSARPAYYDKAYGFCDVAIVGGGPAGLSAALAAAGAGAEVILFDENPVPGGSLAYARFDAEPGRAARLRADLGAETMAHPRITVHTEAVAQALFADNWLPVTRGGRMYKVRPGAVIAATGSVEQPPVFRNNDLPGMMMGSAAQRLIRLYGVRPGSRAVMVAANDDGYGVALDLAEAGVAVAAIVELRPETGAGPMAAAVAARRMRVLAGHGVTEGIASRGGRHVAGLVVAPLDGSGQPTGPAERIACDLVCMSTGHAPNAALIHHAGGRLAYDEDSAMFAIESLPAHLFAAGSLNGRFDLDSVLADGRRAGLAAARAVGLDADPGSDVPPDPDAAAQSHGWPIFPHAEGKDFVDFDEDLQYADIVDATRDGYDDIQLLKRYSTAGMGPSQGRQSAVATVRIAAMATGREMNSVGTTTTRPPVGPIKFSHLAGRAFAPVRRTPMHHRHLAAGAQMMVAGLWMRPAWYGPPSERDDAILREIRAVRRNVGLIDVSTLGGLEIRGPDAAEFMERMYTAAYRRQPVGRARYALMTDESGVVIDDGVACRLSEHHYYVTATTGGVDGVYRSMLWHNAQWRLDVDVTNATAAWCGVNIAGPNARRVLERICDDVDLSPAGFPYLCVRAGSVAGIPCRVLRVGFVGELGYEVHASSDHGEALWDALLEAGREIDIRPFGVEAQRVLRLEKGHIIVGQDTDGVTTPYDAGLDWAVAGAKPYYVGKRATIIQKAGGIGRRLVGFTTVDADAPVPQECHLVVRGAEILGRVTSACRSETLGRVVGLAYVAPDQAAPGSRFDIKVAGGRIVAGEVVPLPFYDPDNRRQEM
jgi:sarcosine oxidase subunit alpha